jgi:acyl carrier protein
MDRSHHPETERVLLGIWSAVLNRDQVGLADDFADLGGDSVAAMRCINRIRTTFGVEVPLEVFFAEPASIAGVAAEIERMRSETTASQGAHHGNR